MFQQQPDEFLNQSSSAGLPHVTPQEKTATAHERFKEKLSQAKNVLFVGAGGGNDAVSSLMLRYQLKKDFGFSPQHLTIAAMLPDVLEYRHMQSTNHPLLFEITPATQRYAGTTGLKAFPEPLLAAHKSQFGVEAVYGLSMREGANGIERTLRALIAEHGYDLVIGCDVGGDFIAVPENHEVLSPMMDAYALHALREIVKHQPGTDILFCVFGLGTDGESTKEMLQRALTTIGDYDSGILDAATIAPVDTFQRTIVQPNRHSRTADFTLRSIHEDPTLDSPVVFKARFHTMPSTGNLKTYHADFSHQIDRDLARRYYLFDDISGVNNPYSLPCENSIEWFLKIQDQNIRLGHELNGQSYSNTEEVLKMAVGARAHSMNFGTPSRRFGTVDRAAIMADTLASLQNGVYDTALVFNSDLSMPLPAGIDREQIGAHLSLLIGTQAGDLSDIVQKLRTLA